MGQLKDALLDKLRVKEKVRGKLENVPNNKTEKTPYSYLWDVTKPVFRWKFVALQSLL